MLMHVLEIQNIFQAPRFNIAEAKSESFKRHHKSPFTIHPGHANTQTHKSQIMPVHILASAFQDGPGVIPGWEYIKTYGPIAASVFSLKYYFAGATNTWDKNFHGQVYIVTGGTTGLGASVVDELASRGAQIVLLVRSLHDQWLIDYVESIRTKHANLLIYAEECDLNSLHSIRKFASDWLNNQTPRRLDGIICCAGESLPMGKPRTLSEDGIEKQLAINYFAHFHLLTLMGPAIRSQPSDRRVRIMLTTCLSQVFGKIDIDDLTWEQRKYPVNSPWKVFGTSKLLLACFAKEYQRRLDAYERSDKTSMNVKINLVNPGVMRSPSTKRFLSFGTIWGLIFYVLIYPLLWIFLKSTWQGAQSFFFGLMNPNLDNLPGGNFLQECSVVQKKTRSELSDEELQKKLFDKTEKVVAELEKKSAIIRKKQEAIAEKKNKKGKKGKKGESKNDAKKSNASENSEAKSKLSYMDQNEAKIQAELKKAQKEPPLFGNIGTNKDLLFKENRYLRDLDAKYEARIAARRKQAAEASGSGVVSVNDENADIGDKVITSGTDIPLENDPTIKKQVRSRKI